MPTTRPLRRLTVLALAGLVLAGCGTHAPSGVSKVKAAASPVPRPIATPVAPVGADQDAAVKLLLAAVAQTSDATENFTANVTSENHEADGDTVTNTAKVVFKRPQAFSATILAASATKSVCTRLVYDGAKTVHLPTFFFGFIPIKVDLAVDDPRLLDGHRRSLKDTSTERVLDTLLHPGATARPLGEAMVAGEAADLLEVRSPLRWKGIDHEVFAISKRLHLPIARDSYDAKNQRIFHMEMRKMMTNVKLTSGDLALE